MNMFWTHPDNATEGNGFGQFSLIHFLLIFLSILLIVIIIRTYKRANDDNRLRLRKTIAVCIIILEVAKIVVMSATGVDVSRNLPLEICSFGGYAIILDAFLKGEKKWSQMLLYLFLPAAVMALVFPTVSSLPLFNFFTIHQFLFHLLIVAYALMNFAVGKTKVNYPSVWKSFIAICIIAFFVCIIDLVFERNFMFLMDPYGNFMLSIIWNVIGGGIFYIFGLVVFALLVIHVFYFIFSGIDKLARHRKTA